jgi:membrane fusion protein (multidrug efflux system)
MVQAAERVGTLWVIDSGLNAGDRIVVEGVQKVRAGMKVTPVPTTIGEAAPGAPPSPIAASAAAPEKTN